MSEAAVPSGTWTQELKAELKEEVKAEVKAELREELKPEVKAELKEELRPEPRDATGDEADEEQTDDPDIEYRTGDDPDDGDGKVLSNLWVDNTPVGQIIHKNTTKMTKLDNRVSDIERGAVDPGEVVAESANTITPAELVPLHNTCNTVKEIDRAQHGITKNREIAARCFPYLANEGHNTGNGQYISLPSSKLRQIIVKKLDHSEMPGTWDVDDPNPNTVRRVIGFIEEMLGELLHRVDRDGGMTNILIDRDAWVEYADRVKDKTVERRDQ